MTPFCFVFLISWIVSSSTTTPSRIYLLGKKEDCEGLVILLATEVNLLAKIFVKILKLTFNIQIGLYCWIWLASCSLRSNDITPKFKQNKGKRPL